MKTTEGLSSGEEERAMGRLDGKGRPLAGGKTRLQAEVEQRVARLKPQVPLGPLLQLMTMSPKKKRQASWLLAHLKF